MMHLERTRRLRMARQSPKRSNRWMTVMATCLMIAPYPVTTFCPRTKPLHVCLTCLHSRSNDLDLVQLKAELEHYMQARVQADADARVNEDVGRTVGGTRGNAVLEYISGAPNKESVVSDTPANPLDYSELAKYGYAHLATPIMKAGGRFAAYELLGLEAPVVTTPRPPSMATPKLVIDRTGESDPNRYSGLKLGQVLDDAVLARALQAAQSRKTTAPRNATTSNDHYEIPFRESANVGPKWTPDWTPERLDEWGKQRGRAVSWARNAELGLYVKDPYETLDLEPAQRVYSVVTAAALTMSFGQSTDTAVTQLLPSPLSSNVLNSLHGLQGPALALALGAVGSSVVCANLARPLQRSILVWAIKGLLGGPATVRRLRTLAPLQTQGQVVQAHKNTGGDTNDTAAP